jgi:hypothetical protein
LRRYPEYSTWMDASDGYYDGARFVWHGHARSAEIWALDLGVLSTLYQVHIPSNTYIYIYIHVRSCKYREILENRSPARPVLDFKPLNPQPHGASSHGSCSKLWFPKTALINAALSRPSAPQQNRDTELWSCIRVHISCIDSGIQTFREPFATLSRPFATAAKTCVHITLGY